MKWLDKLVTTQRERYLLYTTAAMLVIALLLYWVILPLAGKWFALTRKLQRQEAELKKVLALVNRKTQIEQEFARYQSQIEMKGITETKLPEDMLMLDANNVGEQLGIVFSIRQITKVKLKDLPGYEEYLLPISFESDLAQLGEFLGEMQHRAIYVHRLVINRKSGVNNPRLSVDLTLAKIVAKPVEKE
ncbi:MAG: hypothetical protein N3A72_08950 [bacterium]|nr:hypothetical protein [bacterium]